MANFTTVKSRSSEVIAALRVSPIEGLALAEYTNGRTYLYSKVDRGALIDLLDRNCDSLGMFANRYLKAQGVNCVRV